MYLVLKKEKYGYRYEFEEFATRQEVAEFLTSGKADEKIIIAKRMEIQIVEPGEPIVIPRLEAIALSELIPGDDIVPPAVPATSGPDSEPNGIVAAVADDSLEGF